MIALNRVVDESEALSDSSCAEAAAERDGDGSAAKRGQAGADADGHEGGRGVSEALAADVVNDRATGRLASGAFAWAAVSLVCFRERRCSRNVSCRAVRAIGVEHSRNQRSSSTDNCVS